MSVQMFPPPFAPSSPDSASGITRQSPDVVYLAGWDLRLKINVGPQVVAYAMQSDPSRLAMLFFSVVVCFGITIVFICLAFIIGQSALCYLAYDEYCASLPYSAVTGLLGSAVISLPIACLVWIFQACFNMRFDPWTLGSIPGFMITLVSNVVEFAVVGLVGVKLVSGHSRGFLLSPTQAARVGALGAVLLDLGIVALDVILTILWDLLENRYRS